MKLYLYDIVSKTVLMEFNQVLSYTDNKVVTETGIHGPLAETCELSSTPDCTETLRKDWRMDNLSSDERLTALEYLMAQLLFGGETT